MCLICIHGQEINNASIKSIDIYASCNANFSDVLSVSIRKDVLYTNGTMEYDYNGLNYRLDTGDKISFDDLFTYNTGKKNIISEVAYEILAFKNYANPEEGRVDMNDIDYSELEESVYKIVYDYANTENPTFYFSEKYISIIIDGEVLNIFMPDYYENIAIYNRFVSEENLYTNDEYRLENIPVFLSVFSDTYALYYEEEYCTIVIRVMGSGIDEDILENYKREIEKRVEEIKTESVNNNRGIYYESIVSWGENENNEIEVYETYYKYSSSKSNYKSYVFDKILEIDRENGNNREAFFSEYNLNKNYVTIEYENTANKKIYNKNTKAEVNNNENSENETLEDDENNTEIMDDTNINNSTNNTTDNNITNDVNMTNGVNNPNNKIENNSLDTVITIE